MLYEHLCIKTIFYRIIKIVFPVSFFVFSFVPISFSQTSAKSTITGKVTDEATGLPIVNVNLFLANSTFGSTTGKDGNYLIRNIPPGTFELVVSHISYEFHTVHIKLLKPDSVNYTFSLKRRTIKGDQIGVTATVPKDWKKDLKKFTELFIGKSKNSKKTKILNPEVINFKTNPETGTFTASTDSIIRVENRNLGYKIFIILRSFEHHELDDKLRFVVYPRFAILGHKDQKELDNWLTNRGDTFIGSFRHFMKSMMKGRLNQEKFALSYASQPKKLGLIQIDPSKEDLVESNAFGVSTFIPKGLINVHHGEKGNSWIRVETHRTLIDFEGNYSPMDGILKWGVWSNERIADLLPLDYEPQNGSSISSVPFYSTITSAIDTLEKLIKDKAHYEAEGSIFISALDELVFKNCNFETVIMQLHKDIIDIMNKDEEKKWKELKTNQEKAEFLRNFWLFRDLTFSSKTNERLEEHYKRLEFAKTMYSSANGYDDRGRIYIKYGPPEARQVDVMPNYQSMDNPGEVVGGRSLETWIYSLTGDQIIFNFVDKGWGYSIAYLTEDILPRRMESEVDRRKIAITEILRTRIDLDVRFAAAYSKYIGTEQLGEDLPPDFFDHLLGDVLSEQVIEQQKLPTTVTSQFEDIYELNFSFQPALFENNPYEHTLVMAYGLREDDVKYSKSDSGNQQEVEVVTLLRAPSLFDIASFEKNIPIKKESFDKNGEFIHQIKTPVAYNSFYILVDASNPKGSQKALKDYSIRRPTISSQQLHLSSVVFAKEISPFDEAIKDSSLLIRNDLNIKMYPFTELRNSDPIHLYFEIYGLQKDNSKKTHYDIEYSVEPEQNKNLITYLSKLNPFKKDAGKISISYSQEGNKTNDYFSVQLNLSQLKSGNYNLVARVTDSISKETKESKIAFVLK